SVYGPCRRFCSCASLPLQQIATAFYERYATVQYQSVRNNKLQQVSIRVGIWFGTRGRRFKSSLPDQFSVFARSKMRSKGFLARLRLPPIRGHTPSAPRYRFCGVRCLKQMLNSVFQQFDSPLQSAELSDPHYCDGQVQLKCRGAQHFNCAYEFFPGNKASRQQSDSIS